MNAVCVFYIVLICSLSDGGDAREPESVIIFIVAHFMSNYWNYLNKRRCVIFDN